MPFNSLPRDTHRDDIQDENASASLTHAVMAGLGAVFSGVLAWAIVWSAAVDINDPDFTPLTVLLGGALLHTAYSGVKAVIAHQRQRRAAIHLRLDSAPRMRGTLSGILHLSQAVQPQGEWRVTLRPTGSYFSAKLHIPLLRKSVTSDNSPPKDRIWTLTALMDGSDIDAAFPLPIRDT